MLTSITWLESKKRWHLKLRLTSTGSLYIPAESDWELLLDESYPWGEIRFYPSATNSVSVTFPHQSFNYAPTKDSDWRQGHPCLDTDVASLNRVDIDSEPMTPSGRLLWHVHRLSRWLELAASNTLLASGDPFELPVFPTFSALDLKVAFNESPETFDFWKKEIGNSGICQLFPYFQTGKGKPATNVFVLRKFESESGEKLHLTWGSEIEGRFSRKQSVFAPWILLKETPTIVAWQVPQTWTELAEVCRKQGTEIEQVLYTYLNDLRDQSDRFFLFGMPIPKKVGEANSQIHWQALRIPPITAKDRVPKGFRNNKQGRYYRDMQDLGRILKSACVWVPSENWSKQEITTRGTFSLQLQNLKTAVIGCGAMGSYLSESLVRNGIGKIVLTDGETLSIGNLTRHTLGTDEIGKYKTIELARRLNKAFPHSTTEIMNAGFPPVGEANTELMRSADIVVDCTASDKLIFELAKFDWKTERSFFSFSLGLNGKRMFAYFSRSTIFPLVEFRKHLTRWLVFEKHSIGSNHPREGTGCWHSVFPARSDDVQLFSATAVKFMEECLTRSSTSEFAVFEQNFEKSRFMGIQRRYDPS